MIAAGEGPARVAAALRAHRADVLETWRARVLEDPRVPEANRLPEPALKDHVPALLDRIAGAIDLCARGACSAEAAGRSLGNDRASKDHALHRHHEDYELQAALRELSHLRLAIYDVVERRGLGGELEGLRVIAAALDEAMATAANGMHEAALVELHEKEAELVREADLRERFTAVLAHDLRSPLQTILLGARTILQTEPGAESQGRTLLRILRAGERMASMVDALLDFARIRQGSGIPVRLERANLRDALEQAVEEAQALVPSATIEVSGPMNVPGRWDAQRLMQAASNLVRNAVEHGPPEGPVHVELRADAARATFTITNPTGGAPISPEEIPGLFAPFRSGPLGSRGGLGLGLYIACAIVRAHGGGIDVTSDEAATRFTVTLPREPPTDG